MGDVFAYAREGKLQLLLAVSKGNDWNVDAIDGDERTCLHWATQGGHKDIVVALLEMKANVNTKDDEVWVHPKV